MEYTGGRSLYCRLCGRPKVVYVAVTPCDDCGARWFGSEPINVRPRRFELTMDDQRFLRSLRIVVDEGDCYVG